MKMLTLLLFCSRTWFLIQACQDGRRRVCVNVVQSDRDISGVFVKVVTVICYRLYSGLSGCLRQDGCGSELDRA